WLLAAGLVGVVHGRLRHGLYVPKPHEPGRRLWSDSLSATVHHLLPAYVHTGVLLGAAAWGLAALLVPYLIRGRSTIADAIRVLLWSVATVVAMVVAITVIPTAHSGPIKQRLPTTSAEIVGAVAGAAVLLLWSIARLRL